MPSANDTTGGDEGVKPGDRNDYPHDENYRPGYHEGGSRFGFFNGEDNAQPPAKGDKTTSKP